MPTLELLSVKPPTSFFNKPSLHRQNGLYLGKVTLSSSARLDALAVNSYELQLQYKCGNFVVTGLLFVHVQRDPGRIQCAGPFASPAGEFIYVPETVTPGALLYTLMLPGLGVQRAQINITSAQDPPLFPGPFSIDEQGLLRAPSQGLRGQALKKAQSITIPEDLVPGDKVIQVQARGFNLLYEIISPLPSPLYSIGQGELHLLGPLDYEQQRLYRIIILLIDHSQDWDLNHHRSGSCTVTIEVEDVNDHAPECEPPFQELTIYTPLSHSMEVTKVSCWIPQEPQRSVLSYSIVGGVLNNDTPDCDRGRGFLEPRALVCGSADSDWYGSPPGCGLAPQQDPPEDDGHLPVSFHGDPSEPSVLFRIHCCFLKNLVKCP
ncbi:hypothetical protein STEG23_001769 [Scotinomys teguina]